jgi:hypothetical protein
VNDSEYADEQECWKERSKKERAMSLTHGINPRTGSLTKNRSGKAWRESPAHQHQAHVLSEILEPEENS